MFRGIKLFCRQAFLPLSLLVSSAAMAQGIGTPPLGEGPFVYQTLESCVFAERRHAGDRKSRAPASDT